MAVEPIKSDTENKLYAGLVWQIDKNLDYIPGLSLGFQSMRLDSNSYNNGVDISLMIKLRNETPIDSLRLMYIGGDRNFQFNLGGGYSFSKSATFGSAYLQIPYARFGSNYLFNTGEIESNFEVNSLDQTDSFSECPFKNYKLVPEVVVRTVGGKQVQKTVYRCVPYQH
jgi:hypothetical protein